MSDTSRDEVTGRASAGRSDADAPAADAPGARAASDPTIEALAFDEALAELQRTVAALEAGGRALEESIELYARGVALHERCARLLADAELRVRTLVERAGGAIRLEEGIEEEDDGPGR